MINLARPLLAGCLTAQAVASLQVFFAGAALQAKVTELASRGLVVVPQGQAQAMLTAPDAVFLGGLFFTLSAGMLITLASLTLISLRQRLTPTRMTGSWLPLLWLGLVVWANHASFSLWLTLYLIAVPAAVFFSQARPGFGRWPLFRFVTALALAGLFISSQLEVSGSAFAKIRQHWLAPSPTGQEAIDFYYRYSLYPAQALRTLAQQPLRSARFNLDDTSPVHRTIRQTLIEYRLYPVASPGAADLHIELAPGHLVASCGYRPDFEMSLAELIADPGAALKSLSGHCDNGQRLRQAVLYGFLLAPLALLALLMTTLISVIPGLSRHPIAQAALTALALSGASWLAHSTLNTRMNAESDENGTWVAHYQEISSLGSQRSADAGERLKSLARHSSLYLSARAYRMLGTRGDPSVIPWLEEELVSAGPWFVQWDIYRALLRLGWRPDDHNGLGRRTATHPSEMTH
jgi:hypothetical protein